MDISTLFVVAVFALGSVVGGLFVSLQRQCEMERIRQEFEEQLAAHLVERVQSEAAREREVGQVVQAEGAPTEAQGEDSYADEGYNSGWEHLLAPPSGGSNATHVRM